MKINYRLAASFNQLMGFYVSYEEIDNGFIRFLHTKEDYLRLLTATDKKKDWETLFLQKNIDLSHPTIQKFFQIVDKMNDLKF